MHRPQRAGWAEDLKDRPPLRPNVRTVRTQGDDHGTEKRGYISLHCGHRCKECDDGRCRRADMGPNAIPLPAFMNPLPFASQGWVLDFAVSTQISWELINFLFWPQARVVQKGNLYKVWKAEVLSEGHWGLMRWQVQRHLAGFSSFSSSSWQSAAQARHFLLDPQKQ